MKKLYRSRKDRMVMGGLGEYLKVDSNILRISWVLITLFSGVLPGVIVYFLQR